jgi:hypothetical protein
MGLVVALMTINLIAPRIVLADSDVADGIDQKPMIVVIVVNGYKDNQGMIPIIRTVQGRFFGRYNGQLTGEQNLPPAMQKNKIPVSVIVSQWDKSEKQWVDTLEIGWAYERKLPKPKPPEVRYVAGSSCCNSGCSTRSSGVQVTVINNIDINVLIQQSTLVAYRYYWPRNCSCRRPYRRYYYHPQRGYWGHSSCNRAMYLGGGFGR